MHIGTRIREDAYSSSYQEIVDKLNERLTLSECKRMHDTMYFLKKMPLINNILERFDLARRLCIAGVDVETYYLWGQRDRKDSIKLKIFAVSAIRIQNGRGRGFSKSFN